MGQRERNFADVGWNRRRQRGQVAGKGGGRGKDLDTPEGAKVRQEVVEKDVADLKRKWMLDLEIEPEPEGGAPPTVFVAAADASAASQAMAHYVCDGVDDEVQIAAALAECYGLANAGGVYAGDGNAPGGRVLLSEGSFTVSVNGIGDLPPNTALQGLAMTATRILHVGGSQNSVLIGTFDWGGCISDVTLDATGITNGAYGLVLSGDRTRVERVRMVGLGFQNYGNIDLGGNYSVVRDCEFLSPGNGGAAGIGVAGDHVRVLNNYFFRIPNRAVYGVPGSEFTVVMGNDIEWSHVDNTATDSIKVGPNSIVVGNICQDNRGSPAIIDAGAGSQVANNVLL